MDARYNYDQILRFIQSNDQKIDTKGEIDRYCILCKSLDHFVFV